MERDFVYCPGCTRYSFVRWRRELGGWECEDCSYTLQSEEASRWTASEMLAS